MLKIKPLEMAYSFIVLGYMISLTLFPFNRVLGNGLIWAGLILAILQIHGKCRKKTLFGFLIIGAFLAVSAYNTKNYQFIYTFLFVIAATKLNFDDLVKKDIILRISFCLITIMASLVGIIDFRADTDFRFMDGKRYSLGFSHPNNLGAMCMVISIYWFYDKHKKFKLHDYAVLLFLDWICWFVAISRTSAIIISCVIAVEWLDFLISHCLNNRIQSKIKQTLLKFGQVIVLGIPAISIYLGMNYKTSPLYIALDNLLSDRLYLMNSAIKNNGITLLGQYIKVTPWTEASSAEVTNAIDNLYGYLLVNFGIVFLALVIWMLLITYRYALKEDNRKVCLCLLLFMVSGFCENRMLYIGSNIFTIYIANSIHRISQSSSLSRVKTREK